MAAREGITVNNFPRGTIVSVGLHPLRTGLPAGARGQYGLFKCPADTPPAPGKHCDSVTGATSVRSGQAAGVHSPAAEADVEVSRAGHYRFESFGDSAYDISEPASLPVA